MQQHLTQLIDDLDGSEITDAGKTIQFGLEGKIYEIDLSEANAAKLRSALAPFIKAGRPAAGSRARGTSRKPSDDLAAIRAWANANGYTVGDRGRIPADARAAYEQAH